jgi:hypothetical protein
MGKLNLLRQYVYAGKDYGPGETEIPDTLGPDGPNQLRPFDDIKAKEQQYLDHLNAGGEPLPPVTPGTSGIAGEPLNRTTLVRPQGTAAEKPAEKPADQGTPSQQPSSPAPAPASSKEKASHRGEKDKE